MVAHGKSIADMLLIQLETNRNLFGVSNGDSVASIDDG